MIEYILINAFIIFTCLSCINASTKYQKLNDGQLKSLQRIKENLHLFPSNDSWSYFQLYPRLKDMFINSSSIEEGVRNRGMHSKYAIEKQLQKALNGDNVTLYIFGESVSVGADLGEDNLKHIFHYSLAHWWNKTIGAVTGSKMIRRVIAIGGVGTNYFDRCWQEYLEKNENFDMAIWEFNINDGGSREEISTVMERFTRSIYNRYSTLDLLFSIFYRRNLFQKENDDYESSKTGSKRHTLSEEIVEETAKYYNLSCFNIESLVNGSTKPLRLKDVFTKDHPSILSHAHMALLLIFYYTNVILQSINKYLNTGVINVNDRNINLPAPKYIENSHYDSICWSAVTFDFNSHTLKHSLFALPSNSTNGFKQVLRGWESVAETRYDNRGGYKTNKNDEQLYITFNVSTDNKKENKDNKYEVSLAVTLMEGNTTFAVELIHKRLTHYQKNITSSIPEKLIMLKLTTVPRGEWTLHVTTHEGGILLNGIIIC